MTQVINGSQMNSWTMCRPFSGSKYDQFVSAAKISCPSKSIKLRIIYFDLISGARQYKYKRCDQKKSNFSQLWENFPRYDRKETSLVAGIIWNRAQESLNVYNIHSSWRHLGSKSTFANLDSYASDLLTQSLTESPNMNVDFYPHTTQSGLLHQNVLQIFGKREIDFRSRDRFFFTVWSESTSLCWEGNLWSQVRRNGDTEE